MANSRKGPALGSVLRRTSSGSAAHAVSVGQRRWNRSAARTCWALRPRALTWAAKAAATPASAGGLAGAGSIELGAHVRGGEVDVSGDGVDVLVAHQRLDDGKVDAGLGQRGAEGYLPWILKFPWHCRVSTVSYTHLRAHETPEHLVCRLLLEKKKKKQPP